MVEVDRWLVLGLLGIAGMVFFAGGELLGWWHQLGEWGFWLSLGIAIVGLLVNATRSQAKGINGGVSRVEAGVSRVEAGVSRVEAGVSRVEAGVNRVEAGVNRVEAGVNRVEAAVSRVERNTEPIPRMERLLEEIRDRLPPPAGSR